MIRQPGIDSAEAAGGRLGAVLSAPDTGLHDLGGGALLVVEPASVRRVLTEPGDFDFPGDVGRTGDLSASRGETRSGHLLFPPVPPEQVRVGARVFTEEWSASVARHDVERPGEPYDALRLLRLPVARATCAAVLPEVGEAVRSRIADLTLDWIDALAPVIAARRPPRRWSRARRREVSTRQRLERALADARPTDETPAMTATMLAAGIQVPIAAGSWLLAWAADHDGTPTDPMHAVWETLRLTPPTWITARVALREVDLEGSTVPAGTLVWVSPLALGRRQELVAGGAPLTDFDPDRWQEADTRAGAWLPFGAGPHACPGRTLGLALLHELAVWAANRELLLTEQVGIDQSRGIAPRSCTFTARPRRPR